MKGFERLKLTIAYDGHPFNGWQSQANGNGIQDHLKKAFRDILEWQVSLHGAGRTDAGVHALGQVAHVDVPKRKYPLNKWTAALNAHLPGEIRVLRCVRARSDFHARCSAKGKIYMYRIWNDSVHHPLEIGRSWHIARSLNLDTLLAARDRLLGTHDFASFSANRGIIEATVRTLYYVRIKRRKELLILQFAGNGFLYRMVRMLMGSMVKAASGRKPLSWIDQLLEQPGKQKANFTAPPEGLYLLKVIY